MHWTQAPSQGSEVLSCGMLCLSFPTELDPNMEQHGTLKPSLAKLQANYRELLTCGFDAMISISYLFPYNYSSSRQIHSS